VAVDHLEKLFVAFPPGQTLLAQVSNFYGPSLEIEIINNPDRISHYDFDLGDGGGTFQTARIQLNSQSEPQLAAATHELLPRIHRMTL
jgi:anaerobic glycerol-3-phosphate dehydrogenase